MPNLNTPIRGLPNNDEKVWKNKEEAEEDDYVNMNTRFELIESDNEPYWRKSLQSYIKPFKSRENCLKSIVSCFPWLEWLPKYSWKDQLAGDLIGGLMGGVMNITKGSAYAHLAGIPPVNGLYALTLASFVYPVFSSWSQGSMCAFAIIQLMCGAAVEQIMDDQLNSTNFLNQLDPSHIVSTLTFMNGVIFLIFGLLRLQFLTTHFSKPLISGFLTAAVLHLMLAQAGNLIGVKRLKSHSGFGQFFIDLYELIIRIPQTNLTTLILSILCFTFLLSTKSLLDKPLKRFVKSKRFIVPWELLLVICVTLAVYLFNLDSEFHVKTVGQVPSGLPEFQPPTWSLMPLLLRHSIAISIVQIAFHISLARVMCQRKKYEIDELQEIYAMSGTHLFTGFFPSYPTTNGLGRAMVIDACGATSQICSIASGAVVLLVLLSAGPLFYWIPLCVLAVIVLVSARDLLTNFKDFPYYWSKSKWDGIIWISTFVAAISLDIIVGLAVGIIVQMFSVVTRTQWPKWTAKTSNHLSILKFNSMLNFSNIDSFMEAFNGICQKWSDLKEDEKPERFFLLDCSSITIIDTAGLEMLVKIGQNLKTNFNATLVFVGLEASLQQQLQQMKNASLFNNKSSPSFFPQMQEALDHFGLSTTTSINNSHHEYENLKQQQQNEYLSTV